MKKSWRIGLIIGGVVLVFGAAATVDLVKYLTVFDKQNAVGMTGCFGGMCNHEDGLSHTVDILDTCNNSVQSREKCS